MKKCFHLSTLIVLFVFPFISSYSAEYSYQHDYDAENNLIQTITPNGEVIKYRYDALNRLIEMGCQEGDMIKYKYDRLGNRILMKDSFGLTQYAYDHFNRLQGIQSNHFPPIKYDYDKAGKLTEMAMPNGKTILYKYDKQGRLASVEGWVEYSYDGMGNVAKQTLVNGISTEYLYDRENRIKEVKNLGADKTNLSLYRYTYDACGNCTGIQETDQLSSSNFVKYAYDSLNRLVRADYSNGDFEAYTYDKLGNRLTLETPSGLITYEYDLFCRLIKAGEMRYDYDNSGNLIKKEGNGISVTLSYDSFNHLTKYDDGKSMITFEYDGDGNRISKSVNGKKTYYVNNTLLPLAQVLLEVDESNCVKNFYIYGRSRICQISNGEIGFYLYDHPLRNVRQIVDKEGKMVSSINYDSFGNKAECLDTSLSNFQYPGEQCDSETGLIFLRNRYYDPSIGRFISQDPRPGSLSQTQTSNPYTYVQNNPITRIDPFGKDYLVVHAYPPYSESWISQGHGWIELQNENGKMIKSFGAYGDGMHTDDHPSKYKKVASHTFKIDSTTRQNITNNMKERKIQRREISLLCWIP